MKKLLMCAAAACLFVTAMAQTPEEKQASADRLEALRMEQPKACGVQQIDELASKCRKMAESTLDVAAVTETLTTGDTETLTARAAELTAKLQGIGNGLGETTQLVADAASALKAIKNPMKIKSATKGLNYSKEVIALVTAEVPYQGKIVAGLLGSN